MFHIALWGVNFIFVSQYLSESKKRQEDKLDKCLPAQKPLGYLI